MDIIEIKLSLIDEDTDQPRYQFDDEALQELMNSIGELGLLSPIKVRAAAGGRYKIIYGNRRYKACQMLGKEVIPCIVSDATDEMEIYLEQIAENLTREGFSPIEEAEAFHKLLNDPKFRSSTKFLSGKLGKTESYIKNKCELLKFGAPVRKLIVSGSEIRKDRLTEEQLLPLKDLPMEYRDSLALTFARDETPVTDIKRIAKMFKDESVSDGLKSKLLYKSGYELLETWSTFEHNRKERAKQEAQRAEEAKLAAEKAAEGAEGATAAEGEAEADEPGAGAGASAAETRLERTLRKLLASVPEHAPLAPAVLESAAAMTPESGEAFARSVDALIAKLEKHLAEWRGIRETITAMEQVSAEG